MKFSSWTVSNWDSQSSNDLFWDETLFAFGKVTFTLQNRHDLVFKRVGRHSSELILEIKFLFRAFKFHLQTPSFQLQFCPSWWSCLCNECCKLYYIIYIKYVILYTAVDFEGKNARRSDQVIYAEIGIITWLQGGDETVVWGHFRIQSIRD